MKRVKVTQKENEEAIPSEVIAQSIKTVAESVDRMKRSGLSRRAIVVLLHDSSKVGKSEISNVLEALDNLKKDYLEERRQ